mgnify:CR=1 FL=1
MKNFFSLLLLCCTISTAGFSQSDDSTQSAHRGKARVELSGPRFGISVITGDDAKDVRDELDIAPVMLQFGWQYEIQFVSEKEDFTILSEFIPLVGGVEQGVFLPSLSGLIGYRSNSGFEFGFGPNLSITGAALVIAAGKNLQTSSLNFPLNFALVFAKGGVRASVLIGVSTIE